MTASVVEVDRRNWLVGLQWRSYETPPSARDIRDEGASLDADWQVARRGGEAIQTGFAARPGDVRSPRGLRSLAAAVASLQPQPWLGIFQIAAEVWWFIAVRDGHAILPDGDVVGSRAEIEEARARYSGYDDWNLIVGDAQDLTRLLKAARRRSAQIRSLSGPPEWLILALIATGMILAAGSLMWWKTALDAATTRDRAAQAARFRAARDQLAAAASPLSGHPSPAEWLAACGAATKNLPLSYGGWQLAEYECETAEAHIVWHRGPGATPLHAPPGAITAGGDQIKELIPLAAGTGGGGDLLSLGDAERRLYGLLLPLGGSLQTTPRPAALTPAAIGRPKLPSALAFQVALPVSPYLVAWDRVPGLLLDSAKTAGSGWTVKGVLYGH